MSMTLQRNFSDMVQYRDLDPGLTNGRCLCPRRGLWAFGAFWGAMHISQGERQGIILLGSSCRYGVEDLVCDAPRCPM